MNDSVVKGMVKGFKQLGEETVERVVEEGHKVLDKTITGKELLGLDGETMTEKEMVEKGKKDNLHKESEIDKVKAEIGINNKNVQQGQKEKGRDIEGEVKVIREEKKKKEDEEEKEFLENLKKQRELEEEDDRRNAEMVMMQSSNSSKRKKSRGSAFAKNKKSGVDQSQMSQTSEFKGKI